MDITANDAPQRHSAWGTSAAALYSNGFRARRLAKLVAIADEVLTRQPVCRVLDVGGEANYWRGLRDVWAGRNIEITLVNVDAGPRCDPDFTYVQGDARELGQFGDCSFDIVHSNSVIEHVGLWPDMQKMATEIRRLAPAYFVQTPNYWFPYEPHLRVPFIHWMPKPWARSVVLRRTCGHYPKARDLAEAQEILADASLLDGPMFRALFPDAEILRENVGPLTKSWLAIRRR